MIKVSIKDTHTQTFIAALFTMAKIWNPPTCPSVDGAIRKMWYIDHEILLSHQKEINQVFCGNTDGTGDHYLGELAQKYKVKYNMLSLISGRKILCTHDHQEWKNRHWRCKQVGGGER